MTVRATLADLARTLLRSPLAIAYVAANLALPWLHPSRPWWTQAVDFLVLLPLYVIVIRLWTRHDRPLAIPDDIRPRTPVREWLAIGLFVALVVAGSLWYGLHPRDTGAAASVDPGVAAPDGWAILRFKLSVVGKALPTLAVPTLLLIALLRLRPRELALRPRRLGLGATLAAIGIALAVIVRATSVGRSDLPLLAMPAFALPIYVVQSFINGLPEEILHRGLLMQRFQAVLRSPTGAILASALLFGLFHLPMELATRGATPSWRIVVAGFGGMPTGVIWGYLCYRTRSVWPGILWHTSFGTLGVVFL